VGSPDRGDRPSHLLLERGGVPRSPDGARSVASQSEQEYRGHPGHPAVRAGLVRPGCDARPGRGVRVPCAQAVSRRAKTAPPGHSHGRVEYPGVDDDGQMCSAVEMDVHLDGMEWKSRLKELPSKSCVLLILS